MVFENFSMFQMLFPKEMQEMDSHTVMHEVPEKQVIYLSDDEANHVYILKKGKVKISRLSEDGKEVILGLVRFSENYRSYIRVEEMR